jgi:hypothetical protein
VHGLVVLLGPPGTPQDHPRTGLGQPIEQSGSVTVPGTKRASGSCPAGCMAKVGAVVVAANDAAPRKSRGW